MQWFSLFTNRWRVARIVISFVLIVSIQSSFAADTQAPTVPGSFANTAATSTSAAFSWGPSSDNVGVTAYLVERCVGVGCNSFTQVASTTSRTYNNTGLTVLTSYSYRVRARDAANNKSTPSTVIIVVTPDTTIPNAPTALAVTIVSSSQLNLTWTAPTDNVGVTGYRIERCTGASCTSYAFLVATTTASYSNSGLAASTTYRYRVRATDAAGNVSNASSVGTAKTQAPDTVAPTVPTGLAATPISSTQINLTWTASMDVGGVTGYKLDRCQGVSCNNFIEIATPTTTSYNDSGLAASTTYRYRVRAVDAANNVSGFPNAISASTPSQPDTQPPTAPNDLSATAVSTTQINLSWTASTDLVGVTNYLVERCQGAGCTAFTQLVTFTGTSFNNINLAVSTSYSYRIRATDAANNLSDYSNIAVAITQTPPPVTFTYGYDSLGRLTQATGTDGSQIIYQYDANGNVTTITRQ